MKNNAAYGMERMKAFAMKKKWLMNWMKQLKHLEVRKLRQAFGDLKNSYRASLGNTDPNPQLNKNKV